MFNFTFKVILLSVLIIVLGIGVLFLTVKNRTVSETELPQHIADIVAQTDDKTLQNNIEVINFGVDDTVIKDEVTDDVVQNVIHGMSHQKVDAEEKWASMNILMTEKRIEVLREQVRENEDHLTHYDLYMDILDRWGIGDFSQADYDHNLIWDLQGGIVGEAEGLLSEKAEYNYILNLYWDELKGMIKKLD
ncbi:DUF6241 domain-containing protein [Jeotgalibacillus marinus]|uniref:DUF6241 domain-containing protein n=1 Tax=Jeotgalibacillus marinus TaxID=86667 RepID=A0ABV3Q509_9BACL